MVARKVHAKPANCFAATNGWVGHRLGESGRQVGSPESLAEGENSFCLSCHYNNRHASTANTKFFDFSTDPL